MIGASNRNWIFWNTLLFILGSMRLEIVGNFEIRFVDIDLITQSSEIVWQWMYLHTFGCRSWCFCQRCKWVKVSRIEEKWEKIGLIVCLERVLLERVNGRLFFVEIVNEIVHFASNRMKWVSTSKFLCFLSENMISYSHTSSFSLYFSSSSFPHSFLVFFLSKNMKMIL